MIAALAADGWQRSEDPESASVIIVNSCGFIEPAKQESIDVTLEFSQRFPQAKIVMAGCLSQRYPEDLAREMPELSAIVGNRSPERIAQYMRRMIDSEARIFVPGTGAEVGVGSQPGGTTDPAKTPRTGDPGNAVIEPVRVVRNELLSLPGSAYLKVAEGCDNRCSFCAIPLIRGRLRSQPIADVANEVMRLLDAGVVEINLVAQDLAAFGRDTGETFLDLVDALLAIPRDYWIRPLYIYPEHFPEALLERCAADPRLLPYFDIPVQHAAAPVLKRMGRPATAEQNLALIDRIRDRLPAAMIRSTFLVGFYGETDADFAALVDFQRRARIDWLGVFTYSPEDGTPAERFEGRLDLPVKAAEKRRDELMRLQEPITYERVDRLVGTDMDILIEEFVPDEPLALGRGYAHAPEVDGAVVVLTGDERERTAAGIEPGRRVRCRVIRRNGLDLEAVPL